MVNINSRRQKGIVFSMDRDFASLDQARREDPDRDQARSMGTKRRGRSTRAIDEGDRLTHRRESEHRE